MPREIVSEENNISRNPQFDLRGVKNSNANRTSRKAAAMKLARGGSPGVTAENEARAASAAAGLAMHERSRPDRQEIARRQ